MYFKFLLIIWGVLHFSHFMNMIMWQMQWFCLQHQLIPQPPRTHFFDDSDQLILEDELQRIRLVGNLDVHLVVTGVVCAVLGHEDGDGKFLVEDYCWAGLSEPVQRPLQSKDDRCNILNLWMPYGDVNVSHVSQIMIPFMGFVKLWCRILFFKLLDKN